MALREGEWRGHRQWICDEHRFDTLLEATAREHVAEFHASEAAAASDLAGLASPPPADPPADPPEKKGK